MFISWAVPVTFIVIVSLLWFNLKTPVAINSIGWLCLALELPLCAAVIFCFASMLRVVWKHERSTRTIARQLRFNHQVFFKTQEKPAVKMMAIVGSILLRLVFALSFLCILSMITNHAMISNINYQLRF